MFVRLFIDISCRPSRFLSIQSIASLFFYDARDMKYHFFNSSNNLYSNFNWMVRKICFHHWVNMTWFSFFLFLSFLPVAIVVVKQSSSILTNNPKNRNPSDKSSILDQILSITDKNEQNGKLYYTKCPIHNTRDEYRLTKNIIVLVTRKSIADQHHGSIQL